MNEIQITNLFKNKLFLDIISISDKSKGVDQEVKIVKTNNGDFVIKKPLNEFDKITKEILGSKYCSNIGIPTPKVVYSEDKILIETCIPGVNLDEVDLSKEELAKVYFELGGIVNKIHTIKCSKFGAISKDILEGEFLTQKESIESWFIDELKRLKGLSHYSKDIIEKMEKYYEVNSSLLNSNESTLLHSDITDSNVVVDKDNISGIIDFGDLSAGPAMQDFAFMYIRHFGDYKFEKLLEGYGKHNLNEIKFYAFCWMIWLLASKIEDNLFDKEFKKMNVLIQQIIN